MSGRQDQRIETVLHALRRAEPDPALQDRILAALRAAEETQDEPGRVYQGMRPAPRSATAARSGAAMPWLAAAALLLVAVGTLLLHHRSPPRDATGGAVSTASGPVEMTTNSDIVPTTWVPHVSRRHGIGLRKTSDTHVSEARRGAPNDRVDERSFPAPPLPLTEQERLLLRLARHEPPQQLAQLSQPALDAVFQHEKDGVSEFFAPPTPSPDSQDSPTYAPQTGRQ